MSLHPDWLKIRISSIIHVRWLLICIYSSVKYVKWKTSADDLEEVSQCSHLFTQISVHTWKTTYDPLALQGSVVIYPFVETVINRCIPSVFTDFTNWAVAMTYADNNRTYSIESDNGGNVTASGLSDAS